MTSKIQLKTGTRAQFTSAVTNNLLNDREPYLITETDTSKTLIIGTGTNTYIEVSNTDELLAHINDTSTHGITSEIVGTTETQILSNKTLSSPITSGIPKSTIQTVTAGTYNSLVITAPFVYLNTSGGAITINGFSGGVEGQSVTFMKIVSTNAVTFTHNSANGTPQKLLLSGNANITIANGRFGGNILICNGTFWTIV